MAELVKKFDVHANQITHWRKQLLSNASEVFCKAAQKAEESTESIEQLHAKIGQLTVENDFSHGFLLQAGCTDPSPKAIKERFLDLTISVMWPTGLLSTIPEIEELLEAANRVCALQSRNDVAEKKNGLEERFQAVDL